MSQPKINGFQIDSEAQLDIDELNASSIFSDGSPVVNLNLLQEVPQSIFGFKLSHDEENNQLIIGPGSAIASNESATITLNETLTFDLTDESRFDFPSDSTVHLLLSSDIDDGLTPELFWVADSTDFDSVTSEDSVYATYRRIGSVVTDSEGDIIPFYHNGDHHFVYKTPQVDVDTDTVDDTEGTIAELTMPTGLYDIQAEITIFHENTDSDSSLLYVSTPPQQAELTVDDASSVIRLDAKDSGTSGNDIRLELTDPGSADESLSVSVSGDDITVTLGTDSDGDITSTVQDVVDAINDDSDASDLVEASISSGDSDLIVTPFDEFKRLSEGGAVAASRTFSGNGTFEVQAQDPGSDGNDIRIEIIDPDSADESLSVSVSDDDITVTLGTDSDENITSTVQDVVDAINDDSDASDLVEATVTSGALERSIAFRQRSLSDGYEASARLKATVGDVYQIKAQDSGIAGNDIRIEVFKPDESETDLKIFNNPNLITVRLATDSNGDVTSTTQDVVDAINDDSDASDLVEASISSGGHNIAADFSSRNLSGGTEGVSDVEPSLSDGTVTTSTSSDFDYSLVPRFYLTATSDGEIRYRRGDNDVTTLRITTLGYIDTRRITNEV